MRFHRGAHGGALIIILVIPNCIAGSERGRYVDADVKDSLCVTQTQRPLPFRVGANGAKRGRYVDANVVDSPCVTVLLVPPPAVVQQAGRKAESHRRCTASFFALHCIQIPRSC